MHVRCTLAGLRSLRPVFHQDEKASLKARLDELSLKSQHGHEECRNTEVKLQGRIQELSLQVEKEQEERRVSSN